MQNQMTPVVGVPKREPCVTCGFPVFLAERISVGKSLYHRKCLRCARCKSQLTLGSFYETETDGVYCCETCPDEEKKLPLNERFSDEADKAIFSNELRASFNEKLAMFQTKDKGFLQKALSDEEKSQSLKRLGELYGQNSDKNNDTKQSNENKYNTESESSSSESELESEEEEEEDDKPPLPLTQPPPLNETVEHLPTTIKPLPPPKINVLNKIYGTNSYSPNKRVSGNFTSENVLRHRTIEDDSHSTVTVENAKSSESIRPNSSNFSNIDNSELPTELYTTQNTTIDDNDKPSDALNNFTNVTKDDNQDEHDKCADQITHETNETIELRTTEQNSHYTNDIKFETADNIKTAPVNDTNDIVNNTVNSTMVQSRLSQFEALAQTEKNDSIQKTQSVKLTTNDGIDKYVEQNNENDKIDLSLNEIKNNVADNELMETMKPVPMKRATIEPSQPPTPMRRKNKSMVSTEKENENVPEQKLNDDKRLSISVNYPTDLNPFGSDDENENANEQQKFSNNESTSHPNNKFKTKDNLNPFDSSDDEIELLKGKPSTSATKKMKNKRISTNPFGSDTEDEVDNNSAHSLRAPIPTPRKSMNGSSHPTPEPSPRMLRSIQARGHLSINRYGDEMYGSSASLISSNSNLMRGLHAHGSMSSISSTPRHKKGRAPTVPKTDSLLRQSTNSSPSNSHRTTPMSRKKRPAPAPPKISIEPTSLNTSKEEIDSSLGAINLNDSLISNTESNNSIMVDTSLENESRDIESDHTPYSSIRDETSSIDSSLQRKLIPIDASLLEDIPDKSLTSLPIEEKINYRRTIVPSKIDTPSKDPQVPGNDRQWEKMKENKEALNKNRQSQLLNSPSNEANILCGNVNKSSFGKWKRRKGPAPALPIPPRKTLQMLPLDDIRHELEVIEVQQQGLEKQGVMLEKMIRERCEGGENEGKPIDEFKPNSKEVEDLILQLFELVNEKNELFRRQAELMYLRRQHRLEEEQANLEYDIRVLMAQPECNKTDSDKAREESLISRLLEVVQLRNQVIDSLEMDRLREAEEDQSIKARMEMHVAKRDEELNHQTPTKLSKKEKKKQKEAKKLAKQKKIDADKDADESEINLDTSKEKKKKKKFIF